MFDLRNEVEKQRSDNATVSVIRYRNPRPAGTGHGARLEPGWFGTEKSMGGRGLEAP